MQKLLIFIILLVYVSSLFFSGEALFYVLFGTGIFLIVGGSIYYSWKQL